MALLEPPAEILDQPDRLPVTFRILRWEAGELFITPRGSPAGKEVDALRLHVPFEDKVLGAPYWDVTAGNLIARLRPVLAELVASGRPIRITPHGSPPLTRHQVDFL